MKLLLVLLRPMLCVHNAKMSDFVARNGAYLCAVPVRALRKLVGIGGFRAQDAMTCFWKFYKYFVVSTTLCLMKITHYGRRLWEFVFDSTRQEPRREDPLLGPLISMGADFSLEVTSVRITGVRSLLI
jgi:hypothetical protein